MVYNSSTFNRFEVAAYLATHKPYAAEVFSAAFATAPERVPSLEVSNWYKRYFAEPNTAQYEYRCLEASVTQEMGIKG